MSRHIINQVPFLDAVDLFDSIKNVPASRKLSHLLKNSGVKFYDEELLYVKEPSVSIAGIGGLSFNLTQVKTEENNLPIRNTNSHITFKEISNLFTPLQAVGGYMSYLNTGGLNEEEMIDKMVEYRHFSTLHLSYVNIAIFGISSLVENEINCQRDSMHIARITEARTNVQVSPPIVIHDERFLSITQKIRDYVSKKQGQLVKPSDMSARDFYEATNSLYPSSKATGVIISLTLKNLRKFVDLLNDNGKESELKRVLASINDFSHLLWPQYFQKTEAYDYK